jgi:hypothetical protein
MREFAQTKDSEVRLTILCSSLPHPDADFKIDGSEVTQVRSPSNLFTLLISLSAKLTTTALLRRPNPQRLLPSNKYNLQNR